MIDFEKIKSSALEGKELEEMLRELDWKEFEGFIAEIFRNNGFVVKQNFRFKTKSRYEIDLVATNNRFVLCVDCKEWNQGRYKKTGLRQAVEKQKKRVVELVKFLMKNLIANKMLNIGSKSKFYPLLVTLFEEELIKESNTLIVPVWKLNGFLLEIENYIR